MDDKRAPRAIVEELNGEVVVARQDLDTLLAELDRRRHEVMDVRFQLRRHAVGIGVTVAFLGSVVGFVLWRRRHQQRREWIIDQAGRLSRAVSRMIDRPERVAAEPTTAGKIAVAAANAAIATLIKRLLARGVEYLLNDNVGGARRDRLVEQRREALKALPRPPSSQPRRDDDVVLNRP